MMTADDLTSISADPSGKSGMSRTRKLTFACAVVIGALISLELAARFWAKMPVNHRASAHGQLVAGLGFPALNDLFIDDDELFWKLVPDLDAHELAGHFGNGQSLRFTVTTDRRGLRKMPVVANPDRRIVFLGDSCTFGLGVDDEQTFPARVQQAIVGAQCINLGVPGYTAFQGRRVLERFAFPGPVDVVVITFGRNDDLRWDGRSDMAHAAMLKNQRFGLLRHSQAARVIGDALSGFVRKEEVSEEPKRPRLTDAEFIEQIRAMVRHCREIGATPVLVVWPLRLQLTQAGMTAKQRAIVRAAQIERTLLVNLLPAFRANADVPGLIIDVVHAGPSGCSLAAQTLLPVIEMALADRGKNEPRMNADKRR